MGDLRANGDGFTGKYVSELTPVPQGLDPAEAVSLVANYVVAYQVLHRAAQVAPGEQVLIHGAAGGIGTALLQLGKLAGLEMYGTASSSKQELVANLSATPIDYRKEDFVQRISDLTGDGVDAVVTLSVAATCDVPTRPCAREGDWSFSAPSLSPRPECSGSCGTTCSCPRS